MDAYRFSISWSRIFPSMHKLLGIQHLKYFLLVRYKITGFNLLFADGTGEPNQEGISYYSKLLDALLEKGRFQETMTIDKSNRTRPEEFVVVHFMFQEYNRMLRSITGIFRRLSRIGIMDG